MNGKQQLVVYLSVVFGCFSAALIANIVFKQPATPCFSIAVAIEGIFSALYFWHSAKKRKAQKVAREVLDILAGRGNWYEQWQGVWKSAHLTTGSGDSGGAGAGGSPGASSILITLI